jgi:hypothetical protein
MAMAPNWPVRNAVSATLISFMDAPETKSIPCGHERGQKRKLHRFQGQGRLLARMQESPEELKGVLFDMAFLMEEVAHTRKNHGDAQAVRRGDHVAVAYRTPRLNHRRGTGLGGLFDSIGKGEKGV